MSRPELSPEGRIIVALDIPEHQRAIALAKSLLPRVSTFKVGPVLFLDSGPRGVRELIELGADVFLDLKFHDIPSTVKRSVEGVCRLGIKMFTIHSLGGLGVMRGAVERVRELTSGSARRPLVLAVTVLTSHDEASLRVLGIDATAGDEVLRLAALADKAGVDGIVASGREAGLLRREFGDRFIIVAPGIRPGTRLHDQKRVANPREAVEMGADYLVIGRAITEAPEPARVVEEIISELSA